MGLSGSWISEKIILSVGAELFDKLMILPVPFGPYHFIRAILSPTILSKDLNVITRMVQCAFGLIEFRALLYIEIVFQDAFMKLVMSLEIQFLYN